MRFFLTSATLAVMYTYVARNDTVSKVTVSEKIFTNFGKL